jgi:protein transport protein SEC61 subunit gamma and related proteins
MNAQVTGWKYKLRSFFNESLRVLKITKKPDIVEFKTIVKVSGLGILVIGFIGFLIQMFKLIFFP